MRFTIRAKLMGGFMAVVALVAAMAAIGLFALEEAGRNRAEVMRINSAVIRSYRLDVAFQAQNASVRGYLLTREADFRNGFQQEKEKAAQAIRDLREVVVSEQGQALLARAVTAKESFDRVAEAAMSRPNLTPQEIDSLLKVTLRGPRQELEQAIAEFIASQKEQEGKIEAAAQVAQVRWVRTLLAVAVVALLLSIGIALFLAGKIANAVGQTAAVAKQLAQGDLTVEELQIASRDEIGDMADAFNQMVRNLRDLVQQLNGSSLNVSSAAEQLATTTDQVARTAQGVATAIEEVANGASSQSESAQGTSKTVEELRNAIAQIAAGAQEQAASSQRTASLVSQMGRSIDEVTGKAADVATSSERAMETARTGGAAVDQTIRGMERIHASVMDSASRVRDLSKLSDQIGAITQAITDIANQTNLLALNAAIEAARAGEQGKGFAVVAEEVRKLAERAGTSAKEIADLIRGIQTSTTAVADAMEKGTVDVTEGSQLAAEAGLALQEVLAVVGRTVQDVTSITAATRHFAEMSREVVTAVDAVAAVTEENTAATEEMSAGADQVTRSVQGIAAISQENAAAAEEVSASIEEMNASTEEIAASANNLSEIARGMRAQVARFKL